MAAFNLLYLHSGQMEVYQKKSRFKVVCAGRRWGKTVLACSMMIRYARIKKRLIWYVAPSYRMAKDIMWPVLLESLPRRWIKKVNETSMTVLLVNGTRIALKGADNPDCYDDETEILTNDGWVYLKNLPEGLAVMTLNPETNQAEWQTPVRHIHQKYEGPMFQLKSGKADLLVTPNHRFLVDTRKGARKFKTLDEVAHQDRIPASVDWVGEDDEEYSHDKLAFLGFYLAEGCARKDPGPKNSYEITFAQTPGKKGGDKGDVRAEFIEVLKRLGASYHEHPTTLRVYGKELWDFVWGLGLAWEKRIPEHVLDLPPEKLRTLLHWMIQGDGISRRDGERLLYTTSRGMAGDVQELCMKIGQSASIAEKRQAPATLADGRIITPKRPLYEVRIYRNKFIYFRDSKESYISETQYNGNVHCVEVPNHTVYVRRNGKATWSGNSLRGVGIHFLVMDEVQDIDPDAWKKVLRPTLASTGGHALFLGTPKGFNVLYDLYLLGQKEENRSSGRWYSWQVETITSPFIPAEEIEAAKADMDAKSFDQEFRASFLTMSGRVYHSFDRKIHIRSCAYNPNLPIWIGQDFNIDPMSSVVVQPQEDGTVCVIDEIVLRGSNTEEVCDEIERRYWRDTKKIVLFPDPAGAYKQHARGETDLEIFRERGIKNQRYHRKHPPIADRVNAVNRMFKAADGKVRIYVDPKCKHLIESLEQTLYKEGGREIDKDADVEHSADALGYLIQYQFPVRKIEIVGVSI